MNAALGLLVGVPWCSQFITGSEPAPPPSRPAFGVNRPANLRASSLHAEVTVYNQGIGVIKERRVLHLRAGRQTVEVENVAAEIDPNSVGVESTGARNAFKLLEQNYRYDLISPQAILARSVGQPVRFIRTVGGKREILEGTLMSSPTAIVQAPGGGQETYNGMVIQTRDGRIVLDPCGQIEVNAVPSGLISVPSLFWDLNAPRAGDVPIELSYVTRGMRWKTDYVLTLDGLGKASLQGWVTIDNQSGATYKDANLKLLAGIVNILETPQYIEFDPSDNSLVALDAATPFKEHSLFEYHLYTLQRPSTIRDKETKQLSLLESPSLAVTKRLVVETMVYSEPGNDLGAPIKPQVRIEFANTKANGLGVPLPLGRFRIYQRDASGSVQLLGEDTIDHTPRDEKVSLAAGQSFDVVAHVKRTRLRRITPHAVRTEYEVELRNHKETSESLDLIVHLPGDWRMLQHNSNFTKTSASTVLFRVPLRPNEVRKVTYEVQTKL